MTQYKLLSRGGITLAKSSNRDYLIDVQKRHKGSHIVKVGVSRLQSVIATQSPTVRPIRGIFTKRATFTQKPSYPTTRGNITIMPSSWIRDVNYNTLTGELKVNMRGKWYGPWYVDANTYMMFITGKAVPTTTDSSRPARWAKGLGPSLGAAWHKYIKLSGTTPLGLGMTLEEQVAQKYRLLAQIQ